MGQQQSAEEKKPTKNAAYVNDSQKKANRRISVQKQSQARSQTTSVSASRENATVPTISEQTLRQPSQNLGTTPIQSVQRSTPDGSQSQESEVPRSQPITTTQSDPMDVPVNPNARSKPDDYEQHYDSRYPVTHLRPPRLPLPIAGVPTPESPPLLPVDKNDSQGLLHDDKSQPTTPTIRRQNSMQSTTTLDEEEIGDELQQYGTAGVNRGVPTTIRWNASGEKVYVTGTFANWERKYKLHKSGSKGVMTAVIDLPPGTHHLKFIVDGEMRTSAELPTAVDFNAVLVNYLEINPDEVPHPRRESDRSRTTFPAHPPLVSHEEDIDEGPETAVDDAGLPEEQPEQEIPMGDFRQVIPQALIDMDLDEHDPRYQDAVNVISDVPGPPSLPLFLAKSILNGNLPLKDDTSVLPLPNHTVLNHLATSSVKNGILATSVTTRYRKKYVTTIMYRPVRPNPN